MQADETPKYCRDCRHFQLSDTGLANARCMAPQIDNGRRPGIRFLSPELDTPDAKFAAIMREFDHRCGPAARWFEPKTTEQVAA